MKDKKHWNPSEYVGRLLVSNTNILGAEKWVIPTPHKLLSSWRDLQTSTVPQNPLLRDGVNDISPVEKTQFQHLLKTPVSWELLRKAVLKGKAIRALSENVKHLWIMPSKKSHYLVLPSPSWQQSACKYASSQKLYEGLGCKHLSPLPPASCMGSIGHCGMDGRAPCLILFQVMQLVKVSRVHESFCYDELACSSCMGHLTGGLWVISVNTLMQTSLYVAAAVKGKKAAA